jgi:hypothetical protein
MANFEEFYPSWPISTRCQPSITIKLIPSVLTQDEITFLLAQMAGVTTLLAGGTASPLDLMHQV